MKASIHPGGSLQSRTDYRDIGLSWFSWIHKGNYKAVPRRAHDHVVPNPPQFTIHHSPIDALYFFFNIKRSFIIRLSVYMGGNFLSTARTKRWEVLGGTEVSLKTTSHCSNREMNVHVGILHKTSCSWRWEMGMHYNLQSLFQAALSEEVFTTNLMLFWPCIVVNMWK